MDCEYGFATEVAIGNKVLKNTIIIFGILGSPSFATRGMLF